MGAFIMAPLPPLLAKTRCAARPLRSTGITPLRHYYGPNRHRLAVSRFPGVAGYTAYPDSSDLSLGRGRFLQLLDTPLSTVLSLPPRRSDMPHRSARVMPCCLRPNLEDSASGASLFRGHLWVHLRYGPVTRSPSRRWLCQSAFSASFPPPPRIRPKLKGF